MFQSFVHFLKTSFTPKKSSLMHKGALVIITILSLVGYGALVFASPNIPGGPLSGSGGFTAGTELDPDCAPNQVVPEPCLVKVPPGESTTANNGLTLTGANVQLGGTLVKDTNIAQGSHTLTSTFDGTNGSFEFVTGNYGPMQVVGMLYIPTATPYIITASSVSETGANLATRNYITTEQSHAGAWIDSGTGEHRSSISAQASDLSKTYAFTAFGQQGKVIMSEYDKGIDFTSKMFQIDSNNILQQFSYSRIDNQNYLYNQAVMDDSSLDFSIGNSAVAGVFSGSGKGYKLSNTGHEFKGLDLFANQYPSTRDDSGSFSPVNFLYTDSSGKILSAPTSLLGGGSGWSLTGNAGTDGGLTNFIGTTDTQDFVVKTNGNQIARFGENGSINIGSELDLTSTFGLTLPLSIVTQPGSISVGSGNVNQTELGQIYGYNNTIDANAVLSTIIGSFNTTLGDDGTMIIGSNNTDISDFVFGESNSNTNGYVVGSSNTAIEGYVFGENNTNVMGGMVLGWNNESPSYFETTMGTYSKVYTPINASSFDQLDRLLSVGNGDGSGGANDRHNAYTLWKDGSFAYNDDNFQNDNPGTEQNMFYFNYGNHDGLGVAQTKRAIRLGSATNDEWDINSANVGNRSLAFGFENAIASGYTSIAIGSNVVSGEESTVAIGNNAVANGVQSFAFGFGAQATGGNSLSLGTSARAFGVGSIALSTGNGSALVTGQDAVGIGAGNASGVQSFAINATASGYNAVAINNGAVASGDNSFAVNGSSAQGYNSVSFGQGNIAYSSAETVFGSYATNYSPVAVNSWDGADRLFVVGNGDDSIPVNSDAFTILKDGRTAVAVDNFEANALPLATSVFQVGDGTTGIIGYVDSGTGNWVAVSDERKKHDIADISYGLSDILKLRPVSFNYNRNNEHTIGFLAQQVLPIIPESVYGTEQDGYGMSYQTLVPVTVKAIQELNLKLSSIESVSDTLNPTFIQNMRNWLGDSANGISTLVAHVFKSHRVETEELCVGTVCVTQDQFLQMVQQSGVTPQSNNSSESNSSSLGNSSESVTPSSSSQNGSSQDTPVISQENSSEVTPQETPSEATSPETTPSQNLETITQ